MVLRDGEGVPVRDSFSQEGPSEWTPESRREAITPEALGKSILGRGSSKRKRPETAPAGHAGEGQRHQRKAGGRGGAGHWPVLCAGVPHSPVLGRELSEYMCACGQGLPKGAC